MDTKRAIVFVFFMLLGSPTLFAAVEKWTETGTYDLGKIWLRGFKADASDLLHMIGNALAKSKKIEALKTHLPTELDILLDENWKDGSGYWSSELRSPRGVAAILIKPSEILRGEADRLFSHELTHAIHFQFRPREESWIREGLGVLSEKLTTSFFSKSVESAFQNPEVSMIGFFDLLQPAVHEMSPRSFETQYGNLQLYFYFIYRRCGGELLYEKLLTAKSEKIGIEFISEVLTSTKSESKICKSFEESFSAFQYAKLAPDYSNEDRYLFVTKWEAPVRDERPKTLSPYSASLYDRQEKDKCEPGEIDAEANRCIWIRLQ